MSNFSYMFCKLDYLISNFIFLFFLDKTVFGVPLIVSLQRSGQTLPSCIQMALSWLRANALDQVMFLHA